MGAIVFTSAGSRKYHFAEGCSAFHSAQALSDADCGCDIYCTHRMPRMHSLKRMSAAKAAMDGKLPCSACVPQHLRELQAPDAFGHEPIWTDGGYCGGCEGCGDTAEREVCARCLRMIHPLLGPRRLDSVEWPCATAVALGLASREGAA